MKLPGTASTGRKTGGRGCWLGWWGGDKTNGKIKKSESVKEKRRNKKIQNGIGK
jgi:hypothetical protein